MRFRLSDVLSGIRFGSGIRLGSGISGGLVAGIVRIFFCGGIFSGDFSLESGFFFGSLFGFGFFFGLLLCCKLGGDLFGRLVDIVIGFDLLGYDEIRSILFGGGLLLGGKLAEYA